MNVVMEDCVLSESQMKEVLGMGFGPTEIHEHSSMMFVHFPNPYRIDDNPILTRLVPASGEYYTVEDVDYVPTMTSEDIEKLLPRYIESGETKIGLIESRGMDGETWKVCYQDYTPQNILYQSSPVFKGDRKVDVLLGLLRWCVEEKHVVPKSEKVEESEAIKETQLEIDSTL